MAKVILRKTRSLCPVCLEEVGGELFLFNGKVAIAKNCEKHGVFEAVVDPKADVYLKASAQRQERYSPYGLVVPITRRCNLECTWCYLPERDAQQDFSFEKITALIDRSAHRFIVFSGGEPTLRADLPDLIAYVRKKHPQKFAVLLTNGLKLAERAYLDRLKKAGIQYVIFSLNGFRKETHKHFCGQDLSELKLRALQNLKQLKIWTILSMTLAKGVNEDEFIDVYKYGIRNIDFVRQLRLRNVSEIGNFKKEEHIYLSDMLEIVGRSTGFSVDEMCKNNNSSNHLFKTGNYFVFDVFRALRYRYRKSLLGNVLYWQKAMGLMGFVNALRMRFEIHRPKETRLMFRIEVFSWPTPANIDLGECRLFCIDHATRNGEILPFWEALYKNEKLRLTDKDILTGELPVSANFRKVFYEA